jgi:predicted RND superfamily exporter protein
MALWLTTLSLRYPKTLLLLLAAATVSAALGLSRLQSADLLKGHLPPGDPELASLDRLAEEFGGDKVLIHAIGCGDDGPCETVFEPMVLKLLRDLSDIALSFSGVEEVSSLATTAVLVGDGSSLRAERLSGEVDGESAMRFRRALEDDPIALGTILSTDLRTTALIARFSASLPDDLLNRAALEMRDSLEKRAEVYGFQTYTTGHVIRAAEADAYVRNDLAKLTPIMIAFLTALLAWVFLDAVSVGLALLVVSLPAVWAFGLMSWTDRPLTPVLSVMPILILVVGITDAVHFLVRFHDLRTSRAELTSVIRNVVREVGPPTTVTALTASFGFLSFLAARLPNLRDFGLLAAVGVMGAWVTTFTLMPIVLARLGRSIRLRSRPAFNLGDRVLLSARRVAWKHARVIVGVATVGVLLCLIGISRVIPNNDTSKLLGEGDPAVEAERFLRERLRPLDTIELIYEPEHGNSVTDEVAIAHLKAAESILERRSSAPVLSILPLIRLVHREVVDGSSRIPLDSRSTAQLLLLAESADAPAVHRLVTSDRKVARLSVSYPLASSREMAGDLASLRRDLRKTLGDGINWSLTGTIMLSAHVGELILEGQIASFTTAFVTIFAVLFLFLRSFRLGVLGMLPNVYPVAVILAFMGFAGIYLDVGTAMIASILLGVSVDDTVYFLMHYQRARRQGADVADAVAYTFAIAGKPALFCAGSLAIGFFVLGFSSFQSLAIFGLLSGVAVLLAAATELILMPAVLRVTAGRSS